MISGLEEHVNWELAGAADENAQGLYTGAKLAFAIQNYGLAVSLAVLSKEEAQKSLLIGFVSSGLYSLNDKDVQTELNDCFLYHKYKIASSWLVEAFVAYFFSLLEEQMEKGDVSPETVSSYRVKVVEKSIERLWKGSESLHWNLNLLRHASYIQQQ